MLPFMFPRRCATLSACWNPKPAGMKMWDEFVTTLLSKTHRHIDRLDGDTEVSKQRRQVPPLQAGLLPQNGGY